MYDVKNREVNYETYIVSMFINHTSSNLTTVKFMARAKFGALSNPCEEGLAAFCTWLREFVEGHLEPEYKPDFISSLINHAISSVDWYELAKELYEGAKEK